MGNMKKDAWKNNEVKEDADEGEKMPLREWLRHKMRVKERYCIMCIRGKKWQRMPWKRPRNSYLLLLWFTWREQGGGSSGDQLGHLKPIFLQSSPATNLLIYPLQLRLESHYSWHSTAAMRGGGKEAPLLVQCSEKRSFSIKPGTSCCQTHRNNIHRRIPSPLQVCGWWWDD